jgi:phosphoribosylanthranilate isomerase
MKWKICGMRDKSNCEQVADLQPDFMGFIFVAKSPRYVGADFVIPALPTHIKKVGVFVNEDRNKILELAKTAGFDHVQLHGNEGSEDIQFLQKNGLVVIKAVSVADKGDLAELINFENLPNYFLLDTKKGSEVGGTGERFDWSILSEYTLDVPFFLAGGLDADGISEASLLAQKHPLFALDFNSKLEIMPALKDIEKVKVLATILNDKN